MIRVPTVREGQPIGAGAFNALAEAIAAVLGPGGAQRAAAGASYIRLDTHIAAGRYTWTQQLPGADGAWTDGPIVGDENDPAIEVNANTAIRLDPDKPVVEARRHPLGLFFQLSQCGP
jgi:hypothetical protein